MKFRYRSGWSTHLPLLIKTLSMSNGPVLELGMGLFSTPVLHWLCLDQKRFLASYDNDPEYFKQNSVFGWDQHQIILLDDWDKADIDNTHWGLVFIDHAPADRRWVDTVRLKDKADYIIIHDSQDEQEEDYHYNEKVYHHFKYRYNWKRRKPTTTLLSNFYDITHL